MTVRTLLRLTSCPVELRSGTRSLFAKISERNVRNHLDEEVTGIRAKNGTLVICSEVPDYELDVDVDYPTEDDTPWD